MTITLAEARILIARVRSDVTFFKSIPQGKIMTDQLNPTAASSRMREAIDNITTLLDAIDEPMKAAEAPPAEVATEPGPESPAPAPQAEQPAGGSDVLEGGNGAPETAPQGDANPPSPAP